MQLHCYITSHIHKHMYCVMNMVLNYTHCEVYTTHVTTSVNTFYYVNVEKCKAGTAQIIQGAVFMQGRDDGMQEKDPPAV